MVESLMASLAGEREAIYEAALHTNTLLESIAEVVIAWQLLRHAEIALPKAQEDVFYRGKVESARWFVKMSAPKVTARRGDAEAEDRSLMELPDTAF